jgi:hypothetical protein
MSPYLSVGELADMLRVSVKWCYQQLNAGNIPGAFKLSRSWFIDRQIFLDALKQKALSKARPIPNADRGRHNLG